eukprot:COSAG01_NODE_636_length_14635_cov_18.612617_2_plen_590_part_00
MSQFLTRSNFFLYLVLIAVAALMTLVLLLPGLPFLQDYQVNSFASTSILSTKDLRFESSANKEKNRLAINRMVALSALGLQPESTQSKSFLQQIQDELLNFELETTIYHKGDNILKKGRVITKTDLEALSKDDRYMPGKLALKSAGIFAFIMILLIFLRAMMARFIPKQHKKNNRYILCLLLALFLCVSAWLLIQWQSQAVLLDVLYLLPFPMVAMLLTLLVHAYFSFLCMVCISLLISLMLPASSLYLIYMLLGASFVVLLTQQRNKRRELVHVGYYTAGFLALLLISKGLFMGEAYYLWYVFNIGVAMINGIVSVMLCTALLPYLEGFFAISTNQTLLELADLNHPLLKRMMLTAPGTYQHSIMVANLAEMAAEEIKANAVLCRVGGYFHDIGKMKRPLFFAENQKGDNPHGDLSPRMSKTIIAAHAKEGVALAEQYKLPKIIKEFIVEHHGTSLVSFFYVQAKQQDKRSNPQDDFRYPGPKPHFKESGILMLADTVEATVRSLVKPSIAKIENVVDEIFKDKMQDGQLDDCPLTLKELAQVKESFLQVLKGMHHKRLDYQNEIKQLLNQSEKKSEETGGESPKKND